MIYGSIDKRTKLRCWFCKQESKILEWDENTLREAPCKEAINEYISLTRFEAYEKGMDVMYKCPKCGVWTDGDTILSNKCIDLDEYN